MPFERRAGRRGGQKALQDALKWSLAQQPAGGAGAVGGGGTAEDREFLHRALQSASRGHEEELARTLALLRVLPGGPGSEGLGEGELEDAQVEGLENLIDIVSKAEFAVGLLGKGGGEALLAAAEASGHADSVRGLSHAAVGTCAQNCPEAQALRGGCRALERLLALLERERASGPLLSARALFALGSLVRGNTALTGDLVRRGGGLRGLGGGPGLLRGFLGPAAPARARVRALRLAAHLLCEVPGELPAAIANGALPDAANALAGEDDAVADAALALLAGLAQRAAGNPAVVDALAPLERDLAAFEERRRTNGDEAPAQAAAMRQSLGWGTLTETL